MNASQPLAVGRARRLWCVALSLALAARAVAGSAQEQPADAPVVERVEVSGNNFLQRETLLYYVSTKPGDRYDERRLKDDFRRLWDTGFLEDMRIEVLDGQRGKLVVFRVTERKRIQIVDYRGSKALTTTNIDDKLKEEDAQLRIDTFYDINKARRVEEIIRGMLREKGFLFGTVKHDAKMLGAAGQQVSFTIEDGPKAKLKSIEFSGNTVFSDGKLRGAMKKLRPMGFWNLSWLGGKSTYSEEKWSGVPDGDFRRLQDFYLNHGYVTASIGQPVFSYSDGKQGKKPTRHVKMEIPVNEGDQYKVGEIKFDGLTVFKEDGIRPLFKLKTGDTYREGRLKKGFEKLRDVYGQYGYFQWNGFTQRTPDPARKVVDIVLKMEEDKQYFVGKIRFTGNDTTRDKVIRREVFLNESDVFNTELLKLSIRRINQLGYFKPMEGAPQLAPSDKGENKLDVTFRVEEQNRNQFTFGGGVSGLEGTFVNASFSTANFLGLGETLQLSAQKGRRTKNYQFAITEPYLFDRPITAGFDLFDRKITYETFGNVIGYTQEERGVSLTSGFPLGRFTRIFPSYSFQVINIGGLQGTTATGETTGPIFDPLFFGEEGRRTESKFSPSFVYNTVDNPWTPRAGLKFTGTFQVAGGPLGGTLDFFKPNLEVVWYIPHTRRTALGMRVDGSFIRPYGDTVRLPYYQRYLLGGETQIRGYNIRSVGPVDSSNRALGGNKYFLFNAEYYFDIGGPLRALLFFDAGQAFLEGDRVDWKQLQTSTGAELRFIMPVLNVPFRLIYAWNPNVPVQDRFTESRTFKFAIGTTF